MSAFIPQLFKILNMCLRRSGLKSWVWVKLSNRAIPLVLMPLRFWAAVSNSLNLKAKQAVQLSFNISLRMRMPFLNIPYARPSSSWVCE